MNDIPHSVGIDVSKKKIDVALYTSAQKTKSRVFDNTSQGLKTCVRFLTKHGTAATVPYVIESTGDYHLLPALMLTEAGFQVNCINPIITKQYQRSSIRNAKTDKIDAERLAWIGINESDLQIKTCKLKLVENAPSKALVFAANLPGLSEEQSSILSAFLSHRHFTNRNQLTAFAGLDVAPRQSGRWIGKSRLSKRGNAFLRKTLFQIAWGLKQHSSIYQEYYQRLRTRGLHYTTCLIAIARKFLRFFFSSFWGKLAS